MLNKFTPSLVNGYIAYYDKNKKGYHYEHELVSEKFNNHIKEENEVVHHLDLNRCNNNPENLIYLHTTQHNKLHGWITKGMPINKKKLSNIEDALKESRRCANSDCNNIIKDKRNTYCSVKCRLTDNKFANFIKVGNVIDPNRQWPEIEELAELVKKVGFRKAAEGLNVSDNAVRKRLKKFGILDKVKSEKPSNPGWFKKK